MEPDSLVAITAHLKNYRPESMPLLQAAEFIERLLIPVRERESVPLLQALGRVLCNDIVSSMQMPVRDSAGVDGYALRGEDLEAEGPTRFEIAGTSLAGDALGALLPARSCLLIQQGEALPSGFDTVAPHPVINQAGDSIIVPAQAVRRGDFRRPAGHDLPLGGVALPAGRQLRAIELGLLASLRLDVVPVWRRLRVGLLGTGKNREVNRCTLAALLTRLDVAIIDLGSVDLDADALFDAFRHGARQADAVISAGGIELGAMGEDGGVMQRVLADLGQVQHWNLALSPGGRTSVGRIGDFNAPALLFALPDDPAAMISTFYALVRDALLRMSGMRPGRAPMVRARCTHTLRKLRGRTEYKSGLVHREDSGWVVDATSPPGGSSLGSMSRANGVIVLAHDQGDVPAGEYVSVLPYEGLA